MTNPNNNLPPGCTTQDIERVVQQIYAPEEQKYYSVCPHCNQEFEEEKEEGTYCSNCGAKLVC